MIGIFLDDERNPEDVTWVDYEGVSSWVVVRGWQDFLVEVINAIDITDGGVYVVSFDHDIQCYDKQGEEVTGYTLLKRLVDICLELKLPIPVCHFHTKNPVGKKNMESHYKQAVEHFKREGIM